MQMFVLRVPLQYTLHSLQSVVYRKREMIWECMWCISLLKKQNFSQTATDCEQSVSREPGEGGPNCSDTSYFVLWLHCDVIDGTWDCIKVKVRTFKFEFQK